MLTVSRETIKYLNSDMNRLGRMTDFIEMLSVREKSTTLHNTIHISAMGTTVEVSTADLLEFVQAQHGKLHSIIEDTHQIQVGNV
jgi:uncharacterized protein YqgV (UPF0045/DUF77 family)